MVEGPAEGVGEEEEFKGKRVGVAEGVSEGELSREDEEYERKG